MVCEENSITILAYNCIYFAFISIKMKYYVITAMCRQMFYSTYIIELNAVLYISSRYNHVSIGNTDIAC